MKNNITTYLLIAALFVAVVAFIGACNTLYKQQPKVIKTVERDTVLVERVDTFVVEKPKEVYRYTCRTDTIHVNDTVQVEIPIELTEYADTLAVDSSEVIYRAFVSGYNANLDSLSFRVHTQHSNINTTITTQVRKASRWGFGVTAGYYAGYDVYKNQFSSGFGLLFGLTYKITK